MRSRGARDPRVPGAIRAIRHAALGDPTRLAIVDELALSDRSPIELQQQLQVPSNLLAHHLEVLRSAELISRSRSSGDGRRRYIRLERAAFAGLMPGGHVERGAALFVCAENSARSQMAAALWREIAHAPGESAGTRPADRVHPGAVAAAARAGLDLSAARPRDLRELPTVPSLVVTVCDLAHEDLEPQPHWLHWSIKDPVPVGTPQAFDAALAELRERMILLVDVERIAS